MHTFLSSAFCDRGPGQTADLALSPTRTAGKLMSRGTALGWQPQPFLRPPKQIVEAMHGRFLNGQLHRRGLKPKQLACGGVAPEARSCWAKC